MKKEVLNTPNNIIKVKKGKELREVFNVGSKYKAYKNFKQR